MTEQYIKKDNSKDVKKEKMKVEFKQKKVEQRCNNVKWKTIGVESQVMQIEKMQS
jgi:hypothetical protein